MHHGRPDVSLDAISLWQRMKPGAKGRPDQCDPSYGLFPFA